MKTTDRRKYEKPVLVTLSLETALGQQCQLGSAATGGNCMSGASPSHSCHGGNVASGPCISGGSPR